MLKFYLSTVIIWAIIIWCTAFLFKDKIKEKISTSDNKRNGLFNKLKVLFILAAVPIIRAMIVISLIYIAICKQEDFDRLKNNKDK